MAAVQEDISEQREIVLTSLTEQKTAPSQCLEITAASGQEKKTNTVREAWPDKPTNSREEVKIQKLKDITVSQDKKITILERELAETMEALFKEREDKQQLCVKVRQQNEDITKQHIQVRHFEHEMKKNKKEKEEIIAQFSKAESDKSDLTAMLRSLGKEGCKINRTLKEERSKNEKQKRKLEETQKKAEDLQNEVAELYYEVAKLEIKISDLKNEKAKLQDVNFSQEFEIKLNRTLEKETERHMFSMAIKHAEQKAALESEISEYKLSIDECKLSLEKATTKLEKTKKDNKTLSQRLRFYKARSERRGKIVQADRETKAEMKENIETLEKENEKLQAELNSGFIGRFRSVKRFFGRVVAVILSHF